MLININVSQLSNINAIAYGSWRPKSEYTVNCADFWTMFSRYNGIQQQTVSCKLPKSGC